MGGTTRADTSSTRSSERFHIDEADTSPIFVYTMHNGTCVTSRRRLCQDLDKNPTMRCSRKPISRGSSMMDVRVIDLFDEPQKTMFKDHFNSGMSVASVGLPQSVYWRRLLLNQFPEMWIVSPEGSPTSSPDNSMNSSVDNSPVNSTHVSPVGTWTAQESSQ